MSLGYNVAKLADNLFVTMLGGDVPTKEECARYLEHYRKSYGMGVPYPNGRGYYEGEFAMCITLDGHVYEILH